MVGEQKARKYQAREELLRRLDDECKDLLASFTKDKAQYKGLLSSLILQVLGFYYLDRSPLHPPLLCPQGVERLTESEIEVVCREEDKDLVGSAIDSLKKTLRSTSKTVTLSKTRLPPTRLVS